MIKVIWIAVIHWILFLGPKAEAFHCVTGMRAYYESFLQVRIIVMAVSKVSFWWDKKVPFKQPHLAFSENCRFYTDDTERAMISFFSNNVPSGSFIKSLENGEWDNRYLHQDKLSVLFDSVRNWDGLSLYQWISTLSRACDSRARGQLWLFNSIDMSPLMNF